MAQMNGFLSNDRQPNGVSEGTSDFLKPPGKPAKLPHATNKLEFRRLVVCGEQSPGESWVLADCSRPLAACHSRELRRRVLDLGHSENQKDKGRLQNLTLYSRISPRLLKHEDDDGIRV